MRTEQLSGANTNMWISAELEKVVFTTGCNILKVPHNEQTVRIWAELKITLLKDRHKFLWWPRLDGNHELVPLKKLKTNKRDVQFHSMLKHKFFHQRGRKKQQHYDSVSCTAIDHNTTQHLSKILIF